MMFPFFEKIDYDVCIYIFQSIKILSSIDENSWKILVNENMEISELKILEIMLSRNKEEIDRYEKLENIRKYG